MTANIYKTYFGVYDPARQMYWRGNVPENNFNGTRQGRLSRTISRWKPAMATEAMATTWVREKTALDKLRQYEMIRIVRPELPQLVLRKFEVRPRVVAETVISTPNQRVVQFAKLYYLFGDQVSTDWDKLNVIDAPDVKYFARFSTSLNCLTRTLAQKHIPTSLFRGGTAFLSEEDAVMVRMVAPRTKLYNLAEVFTSEMAYE